MVGVLGAEIDFQEVFRGWAACVWWSAIIQLVNFVVLGSFHMLYINVPIYDLVDGCSVT